MKKVLIVLLIVLLIGSFAFANGTEEKKNTTEKYVIANAPKCVGIAWWDRMKQGNDEFAAETGNEVYQVGNAGAADVAVQVQTIEDIIASGADAITVIPADPTTMEPILKKAREKGLVVVSHEAAGMENVDYDIEAFNNQEYGAHVMDNLAKEMGEEGDYALILGSLTMVSHQQWTEGAIKRQKEAYPNMNLVCDPLEPTGGDPNEGTYTVVKELISKYSNLKGVIGWDMLNPPAIARAVEEANKAGDIVVTGTCLVSVCSDFLNDGTIKTISFWDPAAAGKAMCSVAVKTIEGEAITNGMDLNVEGFENIKLDGKVIYGSAWVDVTKANMADYNF